MYITLFAYLSKRFIQSFLIILVAMFFVIISIDSIELIKNTSPHIIGIKDLLTITIAKLPFIVQETFIFVIFFSAMHSFFFLAKHNEYTAIRISGVSIWQFLCPPIIIGIIISILLITILNPFSAILLNYSEELKTKIKGKKPDSSISLLGGEVWLFDKDQTNNESYIINATGLTLENNHTNLTNPSFIFLDKSYKFLRILNAPIAILDKENWVLKDYTEYTPKTSPKFHSGETYIIKNNLDLVNLKSNFKNPHGVSIWNLPYFISLLKATGYPTHKYYSYFYKLLIKPFLVPSIICFAAAFALKSSRHYNIGALIAVGSLIFIFLYCLAELMLSIAFDHKIIQILNILFITITLNIAGIAALYYFENK